MKRNDPWESTHKIAKRYRISKQDLEKLKKTVITNFNTDAIETKIKKLTYLGEQQRMLLSAIEYDLEIVIRSAGFNGDTNIFSGWSTKEQHKFLHTRLKETA